MIYGLITLLVLKVGLHFLARREERQVHRQWQQLLEEAGRIHGEVER